jgi:ferredoxin-NADP reductase
LQVNSFASEQKIDLTATGAIGLTRRLGMIQPGPWVRRGKTPIAALLCDGLLPEQRVCMSATGIGAAPFASLKRDAAAYAGWSWPCP